MGWHCCQELKTCHSLPCPQICTFFSTPHPIEWYHHAFITQARNLKMISGPSLFSFPTPTTSNHSPNPVHLTCWSFLNSFPLLLFMLRSNKVFSVHDIALYHFMWGACTSTNFGIFAGPGTNPPWMPRDGWKAKFTVRFSTSWGLVFLPLVV